MPAFLGAVTVAAGKPSRVYIKLGIHRSGAGVVSFTGSQYFFTYLGFTGFPLVQCGGNQATIHNPRKAEWIKFF